MVVAFAITLYYTFKEVKDVDLDKVDKFKDISGIPSFFSTVIFAMEGKTFHPQSLPIISSTHFIGIGTVMPVENSMIKDKFIGCPGVLNSAMTVVVALYSIIGLFGYMAYGEATEATITKNLPIDEM